jgi:hypothetical protein
VRKLLKERGVKTSTGISMIDFDGVVREFRWIASVLGYWHANPTR